MELENNGQTSLLKWLRNGRSAILSLMKAIPVLWVSGVTLWVLYLFLA